MRKGRVTGVLAAKLIDDVSLEVGAGSVPGGLYEGMPMARAVVRPPGP